MDREIDLRPAGAWLGRNAGVFCALAALAFILSPLAEVAACAFSRTERAIPLVWYPRIILNAIQPLVYALAALAMIGRVYSLRQRGGSVTGWLRENPALSCFLALAAWMALATAVNGRLFDWFFGDMYRNEPMSWVMAYILVFLLCGTGVGPREKAGLAAVSAGVSVAVGIYALISYAMVRRGLAVTVREYCVGIFLQHNHYGYYLAVHIPLCAALFALDGRRGVRGLALAGLVLNTAILSLNNTFGAWLACLAALAFQAIVIFIAYKRIDKRSAAALMLFLLVSAVMTRWTTSIWDSARQLVVDVGDVAADPGHADGAGTGRWMLWKFTAERIAERPLFGFGNEGINAMLQQATGSSRPHNEFMQYAVFYGLPAAALYAAGALGVYLRALRHRTCLDAVTLTCLIAAFGYLASSLFGNTMFYTAPLFFIFMGMGYLREE